MKKILSLAAGILFTFIFGITTGYAASTLKVGASPTPHAELLAEAAKKLADKGIILNIVEYSDYVQPNVALNSGDLDANYFQHKPYLDDFIEQMGAKLASLGPVHYEPFGIYGGRAKSLKDLKKGAIVAVPNDATNEGRALLLLQDQGLIKLKPDADLSATRQDIIENPLDLKIEEIEAPQLARSLPDVDIAVINGNYALLGGLKVSEALGVEAPNSKAATTYANVLAVRMEDEQKPELLELYKVLISEELAKIMLQKYGGAVLPSNAK